MAVAVERLTTSPMLYRKAMMLAKRTGYSNVDEMLSAVAGEGHSHRGRYIPAPTPTAGVPAIPGTENTTPGSGYSRGESAQRYIMPAGWVDALCQKHGIE
jgi:hypothetical protein